MFPTDRVLRNWEIRLTRALAEGTVGGRPPVVMDAPRCPPPASSTYSVKGTLAPESEEGKLGGRGPLPSHPHPDVAVRLDGSHFEETEAQRGRGAWPRVTQLAESESRALHSRLSRPQEAMLSVGPPVPGDPCLPVFQVQSSNSVLSRRAGFPNHLPRLTLHPPAQSSRPRMGLGI